MYMQYFGTFFTTRHLGCTNFCFKTLCI